MKKIKLEKFDEIIYYDVCSNGLPIYMWINEKVSSFYATLSVKYGSIDTEFAVKNKKKSYKVPKGTAHFLEHVKFNEGENKTAHEYFNKLGSSINAFTTFDYTSYEVFGNSNIKENIEHLLDYVETPYFTKKLVNKEAGIIKEEVKMGKNNPSQVLLYALNNIIYQNNNRKYYITGDEDDVSSITEEDLKLVYDSFYHPENMFIVITGNFNPYEVAAIIKENQARKTFSTYLEPQKIYPKEDGKYLKKEEVIKGNVSIPKIKIAYKISKKKFNDLSDLEILLYTRIILNANFGNTSDLKEELLEQELVTILSTNASIVDDFVILVITAETRYPNEIKNVIKERMQNLSISKKMLERRIKTNIADMIYSFDDIEYINTMIQGNILRYNKIVTNLYDVLKSLNLESCDKIISIIKNSKSCDIIMLPNET